jgi:hypothetical protein
VELREVDLSVDCLTKEREAVNVKGWVTFWAGGSTESVGDPADSVSGALGDLDAGVLDIVTRHLRSAVETYGWLDLICTPRTTLAEQTSAAIEPEMGGLGLRTDSVRIAALFFAEDGEPMAFMRAAAAERDPGTEH